jgi:hypothetical protein
MKNRGGRPPIGPENMTRHTVYLKPDQYLSALTQGRGNVSTGLREQLDELLALREWARKERLPASPAGPEPRSRHQ